MAAHTLFLPAGGGESLAAFLERLKAFSGQEGIVVIGSLDEWRLRDAAMQQQLLEVLDAKNQQLILASRQRHLVRAARAQGIRVIDRVPDFKHVLMGHAQFAEAMRVFSPNAWRQQLRSRLQSMGLLSVPRLRIWILVLVSIGVFGFVVLRLLPSANISIVPREQTISQTSNVFLVLSGATVDIPPRVRTMDLKPLEVRMKRSITFDQISKEFIGTSSQVPMTIVNKSDERYSLREGSRLGNQAGMIFRIQEPIIIDSGQEKTILAVADDLDLYGEIIGERGNLPAGVRWNFVGLDPEEQAFVYGENRTESTGGTTVYRTVLQEADLKVAETQLKDELQGIANQLVDEEITLRNSQTTDSRLRRLYYDELTTVAFTGFVLPTEFLGEKLASIPVEGEIVYTAYAYDAQYALQLLQDELHTHVEEGKALVEGSSNFDRLQHVVIDYDDDLSWIKLTVDLSGTERAIVDPLSAAGARFHKQVRELVADKSVIDAIRIIKNLPQVDDVDITLWPPWSDTLPSIPYHISIEEEVR